MADYISTGVKITADASDLERKLELLNSKTARYISNAQKQAGVHEGLYGKLVNAQNKLVEGLTLSQIRLGQYVDELGKVHTPNGEFVADLSKIEQALGFYADELGNVFNEQGKFIRITAEAKRAVSEQNAAQRELFEASQRTREAMSDAFKGISNTIGQFSNIITQLDAADGSISSFGYHLISLSQGFSAGAGAFQSVSDLCRGLIEAKKNARTLFDSIKSGSSTASKALGGLKGSVATLVPSFSAVAGPVGLAVAGIAGVGAGIMAYKASNSVNDKLSESFKELEKRAKAAGDSIKGVGDALRYGAFRLPISEYDTALNKVTKTADALEKAKKQAAESLNYTTQYTYGDVSGAALGQTFYNNSAIKKAEAEQKNAWAEYNDVVAKMVETAREEQKTEVDKLTESLNVYKSILEHAQGLDSQNVVQKQIEILERKIAEARNREAEQAASDLLRAQQEARKTAGIDRFLEAPKKELELTAEALEKARKEWTNRASDFGLESAQVEEALRNYKTAVDDATRQRLAQKLGVDFGAAAKEELSLAERFKELKKALDDKIIDEKQRDSALAQLQQEQYKELESVADSINAAKNKKKADEDYKAALDRINDDLKAQRITEAQNNELIARAKEEYASTIADLREKAEQELGVDFGGVLNGNDFDLYQTKLSQLAALRKDETINETEYGKALEQLKDKALAALPGMTELQNATKTATTAEEKHAEALASLAAAVEKGIIDATRQNELRAQADEILKAAQKREKEAVNAARLSALGIDAFIAAGEREKTAREKLREKMDEFVAAEKEGIIESTKMTKIRASYRKQLDELARQEREAAKQRREQQKLEARSKLGVDSLMEELKSPLQKYRETMDEIAAARKSSAITADERAALENKAADDYWKAMNDLGRSFQETAQKANKFELGKSMSSGSEALYLAQVKNSTANYQSRIQSTTENLYKTSKESLYQSQLTNAFLQDIAANAAPAVFG